MSKTVNGVEKNLYKHWLEVVFNELGWEAAAQLLEIDRQKAVDFVRGLGLPKVDPHELERAYIAYRYLQFDMAYSDLDMYDEFKIRADKLRFYKVLAHQSFKQ